MRITVLIFVLTLLMQSATGAALLEPFQSSRGGLPQPSQTPMGTWNAEAMGRPCLIQWQRSLGDALHLSELTGKPILICVNLDGETASDRLAYHYYRDPDFAALSEGFIPIILSPTRREPRDHDDRGRRLIDRRFGRLVNQEVIDPEQEVFLRYFAGQRVAPRHMAIDAHGEVLFDLYLLNDLGEISNAMTKHGVFGKSLADSEFLGELELFDSPDATHRDILEKRFLSGDQRLRMRFMSLSLSSGRRTQHPELIRLGLRDPELKVRQQATWSILQFPEKVEIPLILRAFQLAKGDPKTTRALVLACERLVELSSDRNVQGRARRLQRIFATIDLPCAWLDPSDWKLGLRLQPKLSTSPVLWWEEVEAARSDAFAEDAVLEDHIKLLEEKAAESQNPVELYLQILEAHLRLADLFESRGQGVGLVLASALDIADKAVIQASGDPRPEGYRVWIRSRLAPVIDEDSASIADDAASVLKRLTRDRGSRLNARLLEALATHRSEALFSIWDRKSGWPESWISEICAAYEILLHHPGGDVRHAEAYVEFLESIQAFSYEATALVRVLALYPESGSLHRAFRLQLFRDSGAEMVEQTYADWLSRAESHGVDVSSLAWFAGLATLMAAERFVESRQPEIALQVYSRAMAQFERSMSGNPEFEDSAHHYISLALSGQGKLILDGSNLSQAVDLVVESVSTSPTSVGIADGLGTTPMETALTLRNLLRRHGDLELEKRLTKTFDLAGISFN